MIIVSTIINNAILYMSAQSTVSPILLYSDFPGAIGLQPAQF